MWVVIKQNREALYSHGILRLFNNLQWATEVAQLYKGEVLGQNAYEKIIAGMNGESEIGKLAE